MGRRLAYAIITLLAVVSAAIAFSHFSRPVSTLVLQVKTFEKGSRRVVVIDVKGRSHERRFDLGDDQGEAAFYVVELPRVVPKQIMIEPLAHRGKFEIDRVTLKNERVSYSWDNHGTCSMTMRPQGIITREQCGGDEPLLSMGENMGLQISGIPGAAYALNLKRAVFAALSVIILFLLAGGWLVRPVEAEKRKAALVVYLGRCTWIILAAVYLVHLVAIWRYSVDVPFWEEWDYFLPEGLPNGLSWKWLFSFAGYHRVVPTKLMAWVNLELFGLDFKLQKLFNYLLFGCLIGTVVILKNRIIGRREFVLFPAFLLFLLSPIAYENHSNSYQSQIHLLIIFALVALVHMYADKFDLLASVIFLLAVVAAVNTFSGGMTMAAVLFPCWTGFIFHQMKSEGFNRKGALLLLAGSGAVFVAASSWMLSYRQPADCNWISPFTGLFWDTFLNLVSFGFGIEKEHPLPGLLCLTFVLVPLVLLWRNPVARRDKGVWRLTTGILLFVAFLATITITRAAFAGTGKASRYSEFGLMLVPMASIAWWLALQRFAWRYLAMLLLWTMCFITFIDDWSFSPYRDGNQMDTFVLETLEDYTEGRGDGTFPWTHPKPLVPFFEGATRLNVKFTRQFKGRRESSNLSDLPLSSDSAGGSKQKGMPDKGMSKRR